MDIARTLLLAPMIVPPIVHALGFYRAWIEFGLIDTFPGLIIAHTVKGIPFVVVTVTAALANFDLRIEQAARSLGCTPVQALLKAVVPSIRPGVIAGAVLAFITSWDEVVVMLFITSRHVHTLPRQIWDGLQDNLSPSIAAVATLMVLATLAVLLLRTTLQRARASREMTP
jgi:putative spermidine/putrescine transport system permease protein